LFVIHTDVALALAMIADVDGETAMLVVIVAPEPG
jgi:hypothetical protein